MVSFADRLDRARAAYARGLAGHPAERPTPDDASEGLGLRDRMRTRSTRPYRSSEAMTVQESGRLGGLATAARRGTARRPDAP